MTPMEPVILSSALTQVILLTEDLFTWRWGTPDRCGNMWWVTPPIMLT